MIKYYEIIRDNKFKPKESDEYFSIPWAKVPSKILEKNPDIIRSAKVVSKDGIIKNQSVIYIKEMNEENVSSYSSDWFYCSDFSEDIVFIIS